MVSAGPTIYGDGSPLSSTDVDELDDGFDDDEPVRNWLPPDDRLWRHPSEVAAHPWPESFPLAPREPRVWTIAVLVGVISSLLTAGLIAVAGGFRDREIPVRSIEREVANPVTLRSTAAGANVAEIAERLRPAIVQIEVDGTDVRGSGSGVLFRSDGHVLTNHHVVEGADAITVVLSDGKELKGKVVGGDEDTDIAVVKVDGEKLPTATLGTVAGLKVGHEAIAIGSPLGLAGGPSVTTGVVSALGRQVDSQDGQLLDMIQTDAPIAPGSSGGALVDSSGAVIGVTTAIAITEVGAEGLGFATPIDIARDVAEQLITTGRVVHVWLGIEGHDLEAQRASALGIQAGALVRKVHSSSPAAKAGVEPSDIITSLEGKPVTSMGMLVLALRSKKPGDVVSVGYLRDGKRQTATVTLAERPGNL